MSINICFYGSFSGGGTERAMQMIANKLAEKENEYKVFILNRIDKKLIFSPSHKISYDFLDRTGKKNKYISLLRGIHKVHSYIKKNNIDILINIEAMAGLYTIIPSLLLGVKVITWEHANFFQKQESRTIDLVRQIELLISRCYIVLTKKDLKNFRENFKIKAQIKYIYNPIDTMLQNSIYDAESKIILSAGNFFPIKNFIVIPDIAIKVFKKYPDWKWEIYGSSEGSEFEKVKHKINEYNLTEKVVLHERTDDMNSIYKKSAIYVLPSRMEGLPMVLLEAKANKIPIVSFDIQTGPDEVVIDEVNGYLVEPYDIDTMANKICELISNKKLRIEMSDSAYLEIEKFNINSIINEWEKVINELAFLRH